ncbi:Alpha/beta hydrolase fold protein [Streptomyces microflavus DSM 40593]|uniref:Alpha/beta hydrolase fold protein n=1 Tax=Streptomyces microflavus DSM 40593 TaxID=1303692 RepID=N0CPN7_STRMI|nr:alpha/beta hydrolase [Streptomyces microflavus]AGK75528.1 Alpha/beta hydrolase fold protein [Streptomyces microflavus DSM 40593]
MAAMTSFFTAPDGTRLAYRVTGDGEPLICLPGGPADSRYLGDLGGLSALRRLVLLDLRGTGRSAFPDNAASYRCDRQVADVEALRDHLGLARVDVLAHSAGANLAMQYAARHPGRVGRLALVGPGLRAVGVEIDGRMRRALALRRKGEPWFPAAFAALEAITEGTGSDWEAVAPFLWGRWDAAARLHHAAGQPLNGEAVAHFGAEGAFEPKVTRAALARFESPVLLLVGEFDLNSPPRAVAQCAELFPGAALVEQPGAGHHPWIDDPDRFVATASAFLG